MPKQSLTCSTQGVTAHIGIGGWTGSRWFSSNVATPENRTAFMQTVADFTAQYEFDGINIESVFQSLSLMIDVFSNHPPVGNIPISKA